MATISSNQQQFINQMSSYIQKYAPKYKIEVCSPILAQAISESSWGTSELATKAHNYFGLKYTKGRCPTAIGSYSKTGTEQLKSGKYISSKMNWCKFSNMEQCVIGYFDFLNIGNYANLKGVKSPEQYLRNIHTDGYATELTYVERVMNVIKAYDLNRYDNWKEKSIESSITTTNVIYRVQVGAFSSKTNAQNMLKKLTKAGFSGVIVEATRQ